MQVLLLLDGRKSTQFNRLKIRLGCLTLRIYRLGRPCRYDRLLFLNHRNFDLHGNVRMQLQGDVIFTKATNSPFGHPHFTAL